MPLPKAYFLAQRVQKRPTTSLATVDRRVFALSPAMEIVVLDVYSVSAEQQRARKLAYTHQHAGVKAHNQNVTEAWSLRCVLTVRRVRVALGHEDGRTTCCDRADTKSMAVPLFRPSETTRRRTPP